MAGGIDEDSLEVKAGQGRGEGHADSEGRSQASSAG